MAHAVRTNTRIVVSFGDCAVTGNVTSLRNGMGQPDALLQRVYVEHPDLIGVLPTEVVPQLLPQAQPLHEIIPIDVYIPGCPPSPTIIREALVRQLDAVAAGDGIPSGDWRDPEDLRFG
jgi:NAD-reducing hydrogenase small subunit